MLRHNLRAQHDFSTFEGKNELVLNILNRNDTSTKLKTKTRAMIVDVAEFNENSKLFKDAEFCEFFEDGIMSKSSSYMDMFQSFRYYVHTGKLCKQFKIKPKFRKRVKQIRKEAQQDEDQDEELLDLIKQVLKGKKIRVEKLNPDIHALPSTEETNSNTEALKNTEKDEL